MTWQKGTHVDPTAGVRRMPALLLCPRCGGMKGRKVLYRPGLCVDRRDVLSEAERAVWRRAT
jgi:hypothetical protein